MENNMADNPERSKFFHHWEYSGNALQQYLRFGPRKAIYKDIPDDFLAAAMEAEAHEDLHQAKIAFAGGAGVQVAGKVVRPTQWWIEWAEGQRQDMASLYRQSAWAYRCVEIRSQTLAQIPYRIVQGEADVEQGEFFDLLAEVNPETNWGDLIAATEADMCIFGRAYWRKIRSGAGKPLFLQRLNPNGVKADIKDGQIVSFVYDQSGGRKTYPRQDVVYFHTYNPDDELDGTSALEVCRKAVEIEAAADEHMASFFQNRAMPQFIFSMDTTDQNELKRAARIWNQEYQGKGNQFKTAFVGGGAEPKEMGYSPSDLALTEVREEARKAICAALGVPPVLVGAWEAANYATADEQRQGLYTETLLPRCEYLASVLNAELAFEFDQEFEWVYDDLAVLQEDAETQTNRYATLVREKIIKPEVAAVELGFEETDVPEPAPVPDVLKPYAGQDNAEAGGNDDDGFPDELKKWKRKALRRLRDGRNPAIVFESDILPPSVVEAVLGGLEDCKSKDDVERVFSRADGWRSYP